MPTSSKLLCAVYAAIAIAALIASRLLRQPFLVSDQEWVLCGPNGVGRGGWLFSGGPARLVVGVSVGRNYGTRVWSPGDGRAWPVECPQRSAVRCGVLPAVAWSPSRGHVARWRLPRRDGGSRWPDRKSAAV